MSSETTQCSKTLCGIALVWNWNGVGDVANVRVANKNKNQGGSYVVFEVEHLENDWIKKDGVNAKLIQYDCPSFRHLLG